jgi:hypothetical protein
MTTINRSYLSEKERQVISRIHKLLNEPGLLRASLVHMKRSCGRDYCKCMKSKKNWHRSWYVVQRHKGKPRMKFIPVDLEKQVRGWISRYLEIKDLLNQASDEYWQTLKKKS